MDARDPDLPHAQLPLDLTGQSLLDAPFTPATARAAGITRGSLDRMLAEGRVRRLLRGVYAATTLAETVEVRAAAAGLVVPEGAVVVDRTAAWVHGVAVPLPAGDPLPPVDALTGTTRRRRLGGRRHLAERDVVSIAGVRVTSPLRTALDLGRFLPPALAQGVVDGFLRAGLCRHRELLAELPRFGRHGGIVQLRHVVALADARAADPAESALRFHWFSARLPTPVPGLVVDGAGLRLALGLPVQRFGVVVLPDLRAEEDRLTTAELLGWRVVSTSADRLLRIDPELLVGYLESEFHLQLLREVG